MILKVPHTALLARPSPEEGSDVISEDQSPYMFACAIYGIPTKLSEPSFGSFAVPFASSFESLCSLTEIFATNVISGENPKAARESLCHSLLLLGKLVSRTGKSPIEVRWDPTKWLSIILDCLGQEVHNTLYRFLFELMHSIAHQFHDC